MIKCVIIDDERRSVNLLKVFIAKVPLLRLVGESTSPLEGIEIITREKPDVVFLDIEMREMNGLEVAKIIRHITKIIFTTAHAHFAVDSYDVEAVDFLKKPIAFDRFEFSIHKLAKNMAVTYQPTEKLKKGYTFVRAEKKGSLVKVDFDDIIYIRALRNYIIIYCYSENIIARYSFTEIIKELQEDEFVRVHRSFIVSIKNIQRVNTGAIIMKSGKKPIPIGESYALSFLIAIGQTPQ